ncbi:MAG: EAL domain-containing protein [Lachnospiraceae bacterium]|nr:EAL domain-containing protein [Lachnospiraceae bacterium]
MYRELNQEKKDNQEIEEIVGKMNSITEGIPGGFGVYLIADSIIPVSVNYALTKLMDYSREEYMELFARDASSTVYREDLERMRQVISRAGQEGQSQIEKFRLIRKDQTLTWVNISVQKNGTYREYDIFFCLVTDINEQIADEIKVQKAHALLTYQATHDSLTGICNRENFYRKVRILLDQNPKKSYVLARWNIERFKVINDLFGMETGDQILKEIAGLFQSIFHEVGAYARLEADHFALFYPEDYITPEELLKRSDEKFHEYQKNYSVMCSFGIYRIEDVQLEINKMCDRANLAYQTIRGNYIQRYAYYDEALRSAIIIEQEITGEMDRALREEEFEVFIQPIFGVLSNLPESGEALIRWRHPKKGMLSPGFFIPLFEKNGFITKLDYYVWEKTCAYIRRCFSEGSPIVPISVNVSRMNLYDPNLPEEISALTEKYQIPNSMLKLEITESAYMDNPQQLIETTKKLQERGFHILMDDFGSGYSSLNMLKELPVDILKIDIKFIDDLERSKRAGGVVTSIVRMARWLNMQIVAEGVETKSQLNFLRTIGCECVQGFYFAKPMPMKEFQQLLHDRKPAELQDDIVDILRSFDFDAIWTNPKMALLFNGIVQGMAFYEMDQCRLSLIRANDGFYEMLGEDAAQMQQEPAFAHVVEQDEQLMVKACINALQSGRIETAIIRRNHQDGHLMWIEAKVRFLGRRGKHTVFYLALNEATEGVRSVVDTGERTDQLKELLKDEENIVECARTLSSIHDEDLAINMVLERLLKYYQAERSYVFEFRWEQGRASNTYERCAPGITPEIQNLQDVAIEDISFWIDQFSKQSYIHIPSVEALKAARRVEWEYLAPQKIKSLMAVPFYSDKTIRGFIGVDNPAIESDRPHYLINLTYFISNEIEKRNMNKRLYDLSYRDGLTGLFNRNRYLSYVESFCSTPRHEGVGIIFLDVNGLKRTNDSKGHRSGDARIKETAEMMKEVCPDDLLFRLSGDEFLIACDDCSEKRFLEKVKKLKTVNCAAGREHAAIGAAWRARPGSIEELANEADCQMYLQKKYYYAKNVEDDRRNSEN